MYNDTVSCRIEKEALKLAKLFAIKNNQSVTKFITRCIYKEIDKEKQGMQALLDISSDEISRRIGEKINAINDDTS